VATTNSIRGTCISTNGDVRLLENSHPAGYPCIAFCILRQGPPSSGDNAKLSDVTAAAAAAAEDCRHSNKVQLTVKPHTVVGVVKEL